MQASEGKMSWSVISNVMLASFCVQRNQPSLGKSKLLTKSLWTIFITICFIGEPIFA